MLLQKNVEWVRSSIQQNGCQHVQMTGNRLGRIWRNVQPTGAWSCAEVDARVGEQLVRRADEARLQPVSREDDVALCGRVELRRFPAFTNHGGV